MTFGWDYPPGAMNDPRAPWNETETCPSTWGDNDLPCERPLGHPGDHFGITYEGASVSWENDEDAD